MDCSYFPIKATDVFQLYIVVADVSPMLLMALRFPLMAHSFPSRIRLLAVHRGCKDLAGAADGSQLSIGGVHLSIEDTNASQLSSLVAGVFPMLLMGVSFLLTALSLPSSIQTLLSCPSSCCGLFAAADAFSFPFVALSFHQ